MDDDFYNPASKADFSQKGLFSTSWQYVLSIPVGMLVTILLCPILLVIATRLLSARPSRKVEGQNGSTVEMLPYWFPGIGHAISIMWNPVQLMTEARDLSAHGIFALNLGSNTHNIISNPELVKSTMSQKESAVQFHPIAQSIAEKFFGVPKKSKPKYDAHWAEFNSLFKYLMVEPQLSAMVNPTIRKLELNIPQMISFMDTEIDLQPWEKFANPKFISANEMEMDLAVLARDILGFASVPGMFGNALLEKYPNLLHDVYDMDDGLMYFLMGLPAWTPWPGVLKAHLARMRIWRAMDDQQRALDAITDGTDADYSWGDLDDVSEFIKLRHEIFKTNGFEIKERGDPGILWALVGNASLIVFWHILYIVSTPGLLPKIRSEITPYAKVSEPVSIGRISEAPKLSLSHEDLCKNCPLFKSTYFEALRLSGQPWSIRHVASDVTVSSSTKAIYNLKKGEYITLPHDLHMRDPAYFPSPSEFIPERFLRTDEDGTQSAHLGTARPFGGGPSMCKGRAFAERECLSMVAGVLMFWDFEPVGRKGWVVPKMVKTTAVSRPKTEVRVKIKRRMFEWDE